ncbi:MAG: lipoprotein-releasing ABC transporter permease subunit [Gammaproteobacteria bacterium]|nr:MAG: lipoprotein-releasing ABC transporter permease subunit [Gammaproteobacteria bacterium]
MLRPVPLFIALRYLREHRENQFASFVTVASVLGVALGVAALIVVLSVMNGFERELRDRLLGMAGHATVTLPAGEDWRAVRADLLNWPGIEAAAPFVELQGMISTGRTLAGITLVGVEPPLENSVSRIEAHLRQGRLQSLRPGSDKLLLGRALALRLGLRVGDPVTLMVPQRRPGVGLRTRLRQFELAGIFELGLQDHDSIRGLIDLDDALALAGESEVRKLRLRAADVFAAPALVRAWAAAWAAASGRQPIIRDWTQDNATYFRAVHMEKLMMTLLLSLIVAVAAFNIVATLVMTVSDKRSGIAILRTLGYPRRTVMGIFALQGLVVGWFGVLLGVAGGLGLAGNISTVAPRLERLFGFQFMPADVYYLTELPAEIQGADVAVIALIALLMTAAATVYPAMRAAAVAPAEVLRYE